MAFDESNLHRNEKIILDLHPHWIMLAKGIVLVVLAVAAGIWVLTIDITGIVKGLVGLAILASVIYMLQRTIAWVSTNFVVTTDRCIYREGIISKRGVEIPLERINTVFFNQSIVDRVIGAGTLTIESAGENGVQTFEDVRDPIGVQQVLYQEMEDNENRKFDRVRAPASQLSVADEITKLAALRDQGHLSPAEFEAQKAKLLGQQQPPPTV